MKTDNTSLKLGGRAIARNTLFSLMAKVLPLFIGFVSLPFIVRGLGTERFGLLSLNWTVIIYFSILDLGLGQATTKFVAEILGKGEIAEIRQYVWTATLTQTFFGLIGTGMLIILNPMIIGSLLKIPPHLIVEGRMMMYILAIAIPFLLVNNSLRGVLEASQRFDLIALISIPTSSCTFLIPLFGVICGWSLTAIIGLIVAARAVTLLIFGKLCLRLYPILVRPAWPTIPVLRTIAKFGGWITVSGFVAPLFASLDKFFIGSLLGMGSVAYYTASADLARRTSIISTSLGETLFPAFSALEGGGHQVRSQTLYQKAIKFQFLTIGMVTGIIVVSANDILRLWLGPEFARAGTIPLQVIVLGVCVNNLARVPFSMLLAKGRSDLPAKINLIMLPIYGGMVWGLTRLWGISGTSLAVSINMVAISIIFFIYSFKLWNYFPLAREDTLKILIFLMVFVGGGWGICHIIPIDLIIRFCLFVFFIMFSIAMAWKYILDELERASLLMFLNTGVRWKALDVSK